MRTKGKIRRIGMGHWWSYNSQELASIHRRLQRAMAEAMERQRRQEEGREVMPDAVEWWRITDVGGNAGKLVVYPIEKGREMYRPYPYRQSKTSESQPSKPQTPSPHPSESLSSERNGEITPEISPHSPIPETSPSSPHMLQDIPYPRPRPQTITTRPRFPQSPSHKRARPKAPKLRKPRSPPHPHHPPSPNPPPSHKPTPALGSKQATKPNVVLLIPLFLVLLSILMTV